VTPLRAPCGCLAIVAVALTGCGPDGVDVDADVEADVDAESDACDPGSSQCCDDRDCSDHLYCNGVEVCIGSECRPDPDAVCTPGEGCRIPCDDGIDCTDDFCDETTNRCVNRAVHDLCDDGDICTGDERCAPLDEDADPRGCVHGSPWRCEDGDPCTDDFCEAGECRVAIRDSDGDGFGAIECEVCDPSGDCERGTDCDDANDTVYPGAVEICDDGADNNCDRYRDYADPACSVPNDTCGTALELRPGLVTHASTRGTGADITTACGAAEHHDVAFHFTTMTIQDATVRVVGRAGGVTASLTAACGDPELEIRCLSGRTFDLHARVLPPGTYYVIITSASELDFDISVELADPFEPVAGDMCIDALEIDDAGGAFTGGTEGMWPDYDSRCGDATDLDVTYVMALAEPRSMDISVTPGAGPVAVAIQPDCGIPGRERSCFVASEPVVRSYGELAAGIWYLIFKTPDEDTFDFEIFFGPPRVSTLLPWLDPTGDTSATLTGSVDDGQYDVEIAPLDFPFDGELHQCIAVSTNGYLRFGPAGACPRATGYTDSETDIDSAFGSGRAQVSWLGDDGYSGSSVTYRIDEADSRVIITYLGYHRLGRPGLNDIQIVLSCDTGDIQISYGDCTFDNTNHWSIGVSEPALEGATLQPHDFTTQVPGEVVSFGPGAIAQTPDHDGADAYRDLNGRAISFTRSGTGWDVTVDELPL